MKTSMQATFGPMEVQRLDKGGETKVQKSDEAEMPLEEAKKQIGEALHKTIARTDAVLKDFGDPSLVKRFCEGEVPSVLARAWQRQDRRRELLRALIEKESTITTKTIYVFEEKRTA